MRFRILSIVVLLAALGASRLACAAPEWQGHGAQWCLVQAQSQMCLPEVFDIYKAGLRYADFHIEEPGSRANVFLSYVSLGGPDGRQTWVEGESDGLFVLDDSRTVGELTVSRYSVNPVRADLSIITYVLELPGLFALAMNSSNESYVVELAQALAEEWKSESRVKPNLRVCGKYAVSGSDVECPNRNEKPDTTLQ